MNSRSRSKEERDTERLRRRKVTINVQYYWAPLAAQSVKNQLAMQETRVPSRGWKIPWRRKWLPTPVFLPGKSHGQRSLAGYNPRGRKESDDDLENKPPTTIVDTGKGTGQFIQNLWERKRAFFGNVLMKVRKQQLLSTEIHLPLVIGWRSLPMVWLQTVPMTDQTSSVGISEGPGAPSTDSGLHVWGTPR